MNENVSNSDSQFACFMIAAQTQDGFIARQENDLSTRWTSKEDAAFFKQKTIAAEVIVMGRTTYETFKRSLPQPRCWTRLKGLQF